MFELTRWSPLGSAFHLHRELDEMLGRFLGQERLPTTYRQDSDPVAWAPAIESYAKDGQLHVRVALPGVDPKDVEVTVSDDSLTIRGERKAKTENQDGRQYFREFTYGSFERVLTLPEGIDPGKVQAKFANGMLDLTMPAPVAVVPKKVEIQIESGGEQKKAIKTA
jgi:HSP20 family protein